MLKWILIFRSLILPQPFLVWTTHFISVKTTSIYLFFNPILHRGISPTVRKIRNNRENSQAAGLAEIFIEPNLVLKNLWKFQPYTIFGWRVMGILSSMIDLDFFQWKNECICVYMQKFNFTLLHILSSYYIENCSILLSIYYLIFEMSCDVIWRHNDVT